MGSKRRVNMIKIDYEITLSRHYGVFIDDEKQPLVIYESYDDAFYDLYERKSFKHLTGIGLDLNIKPIRKKQKIDIL